LEARLQDLSERLRRGAYRAQPVRRLYIPKADGRQRPIGIPALEDKLVQRSATAVLQAVYEVDFKGFSYGFRPRRGAHDALDALAVGIHARRVNWMLDADVRGFFDAIDHECLVKFVEHRIADRCVVRHIRKWLKAGVLEDGQWMRSEAGTPQGGSISPLLANIYLHYAFDLWAEWWRSHQASGDVIVVRYADDFVVGFEHRSDAERFQADLAERFRKFALELHADKTRLIEFGRHAARTRSARGAGKPETFDFLGFTHVCGTTRKGKFIVARRPMQKRVRRTLAAIKEVLRRRLHHSIAEVGQWLGTVMRGWYQYYAVPLTSPQLGAFRTRVGRLWYGALRRRSYKTRITWERMHRLIACWLPEPRILHPYPWERLRV
jgi:group II intron reverse transcriptase/maturase